MTIPQHRIVCVVFKGYEMLDVFGPLEMFEMSNRVLKDDAHLNLHNHPGYALEIVAVADESSSEDCPSLSGICIKSKQFGTNKAGSRKLLDVIGANDTLFIPGGLGTRDPAVTSPTNLDALRRASVGCARVMTVCTGSALLAATGLLDGVAATSNKRAFESFVKPSRPQVKWQGRARWVRSEVEVPSSVVVVGESVDDVVSSGKRARRSLPVWTSSGVSAGMDMALGMIAEDFRNVDFARAVAKRAEYVWNENADDDPFPITA